MEVLTKDGLTYYHNKIKNTFVKQSDLDTAIDNKLDTIDWVTEIGDAYVTPEQVSDIISQSDLDNYLPKSGGTMTGGITLSGGGRFLVCDVTDKQIQFCGGTNPLYGAGLYLNGIGFSGNEGYFTLTATDSQNSKSLIGRPNGQLTWSNNLVATFDSNNKLVFPDGTTVWIELPT